jgi:hypothetical protein
LGLLKVANPHVGISTGGNCMMNGKVIGVYNKDNILSATASKYNFEGALRPCS